MRRVTGCAAVAVASTALALPTLATTSSSATTEVAIEWTAPSAVGGPSNWTKISAGDPSLPGQVSMFRTSDGVLHVAYPQGRDATTSLAWSNLSRNGGLIGQGTIVSGWDWYRSDVSLIPAPNDRLRVVFNGVDYDGGAPYDDFRLYAATADSDGTSWMLAPGSLTSQSVNSVAAVAMPGQPPIVAGDWNEEILWRQADGTATPTTPDNSVAIGPCCAYHTTLARDSKDGRVFLGWHSFHHTDNTGATFVRRLRPTAGPRIRVPGLSSYPHQKVALTGRRGAPGVYAAYCTGEPCHHVNLWRVGAQRAITVPRSADANTVAIAPAPGGRMWVVWQSRHGVHRLYATLTNKSATRFGAVRIVNTADQVYANHVSAYAGASRRLDVVVEAGGVGLYHRQLLPGLTLSATPRRIDNDKRHVVTFTVSDAGAPVAGATVRIAGRTDVTSAMGKARIVFRKGIRPGRRHGTAAKPAYAKGHATVRILR